jgi:hypothetical protein
MILAGAEDGSARIFVFGAHAARLADITYFRAEASRGRGSKGKPKPRKQNAPSKLAPSPFQKPGQKMPTSGGSGGGSGSGGGGGGGGSGGKQRGRAGSKGGRRWAAGSTDDANNYNGRYVAGRAGANSAVDADLAAALANSIVTMAEEVEAAGKSSKDDSGGGAGGAGASAAASGEGGSAAAAAVAQPAAAIEAARGGPERSTASKRVASAPAVVSSSTHADPRGSARRPARSGRGSNVDTLVAMGFDTTAAQAALMAHKGDLQAATDWLLGI